MRAKPLKIIEVFEYDARAFSKSDALLEVLRKSDGWSMVSETSGRAVRRQEIEGRYGRKRRNTSECPNERATRPLDPRSRGPDTSQRGCAQATSIPHDRLPMLRRYLRRLLVQSEPVIGVRQRITLKRRILEVLRNLLAVFGDSFVL